MDEHGDLIAEGKTKVILARKGCSDAKDLVLMQNKDEITAGNAQRRNQLPGKAAVAAETTALVFDLLQRAGIATHYVRSAGPKTLLVRRCEMVPVEWVARRVATGSFLRRNPGVPEGFRFRPVRVETFFKDDAADDPQWSFEQILTSGWSRGGRAIGESELRLMSCTTSAVFELLERYWASRDCVLVDMKIEFGVHAASGDVLVADVIDSDSWRLWPKGDKRLMKDKQVYRDLVEVTPAALDTVLRNFRWVRDELKAVSLAAPVGRLVVVMGSAADLPFARKISAAAAAVGVARRELRVCSAHKSTDDVLRLVAGYEDDPEPTVFVAVAGRSNGLGPVISGNTALPVINCPPLPPGWASEDVWSSLRLPSGVAASTVITPEGAALAAASVLALHDRHVWARLRAARLRRTLDILSADFRLTTSGASDQPDSSVENGQAATSGEASTSGDASTSGEAAKPESNKA